MNNHEYSVLGGINRARIGQAIAIIAAAASSILVALLLAAVDVAKALGFGAFVPNVLLPPIGAGLVFTSLYWLFERHGWRIPALSRALGVPDLSGTWHCQGQTINPDKSPGFTWEAVVIIAQSWDRIRVRLQTSQSASSSTTAALIRDECGGYRLFYSYRNDPKIDQPELQSHRGSAELVFSPDLTAAEGEYFNGLGRFTFGKMLLTKETEHGS